MNIPPLISRTPPPLPDDDDDDDDEEFGSYVIGDIIDNGSGSIFRSINGDTAPSAYDFIQTNSIGPVKDSPEKINFYKNVVDSPTTSSAKDHLPDVIPDCEPVVPTGLCDDVVFNVKGVPSDLPGPSPTNDNHCDLSNGVAGSTPEKPNESDSFLGTVTLTGTVTVTPVSSNEILSDTIVDGRPSTTPEPSNVNSGSEDAPAKEDPSIPDEFTSFAFEKLTDQKQYFDEKVDLDVTEKYDLPQTESLGVLKSQHEPVDEIVDADFTSFAFERPIDQNYLNSNGDYSGETKEFSSPFDSPKVLCPNRETPAVPDIDDFTNSDFRVEDKTTLDADEFTSFAFEKPVDESFTSGQVSADISDVPDIPLSSSEPLDDVHDVDDFTSFAFEKPVDDGFGVAGFSSTADCEADEFLEFADFQTSSEADFVFQEPAPVAEFRTEDASTAGDIDEFDATLVGKIDNNTVWCRLRYLEDTPALKYQWLSSSSNHRLLSALKIDSRNIFCGPWSRSAKILGSDSRSGAQHDVSGSPSGGYHERCHLHEASVDPNAKPTVPDAHFDWEGSGLVNPLFSSAKDGETLHCDIGGIIGNQMSREASDILKSLPDLSYMTKTYLVFKPLPVPL